MSDGESRRRPRIPAAVRRGGLAAIVLGLLVANGWYFRREFPGAERQRNEAYDRGLKALDEGRYSEAALHFRKFIEIEPTNRRVRLLLAQTYAMKGDMAEARSLYQEIVDGDETADDARIGLAELARAELDFEEAFRQLAAARAAEPTPAVAWSLAGQCLAEAGDLDGAIEMFRLAVKRDAGLFDAQLTLGDLLLARSMMTGRVDERVAAEGCYRAAEDALRARSSNQFDARLGLALAKALAGQARAGRRQGIADAVAQLRRLAEADPKDPTPTLFLAEILVNAGDFVEARRTLEDALRRWNTPLVVGAFHTFLASRGETAEALRVLERGVSEHREDSGLRVRLIAYLVQTGKVEDADRELTSAETVLGNDPRVLEARGDLARELERRAREAGRDDEAARQSAVSLDAYGKALALRPRSPRVKKKLAAQYMDAAARGGSMTGPQADAARKFIEDVLRVNPSDPEALEWRAQMLAVEGRWKEVAELLRPALRSPASPPGLLRLLGEAAARTGADDLAGDAYAALIDRLAPPDESGKRQGELVPDTDWAGAVQALLRAGRPDAALATAQAARLAWPDSGRVLVALATVRLTAGDIAGALADLRDAPERFRGDADVRIIHAQALEGAGRTDDAEAAWKSLLADLDSEQVRLRYFDFLVRTGRAADAEEGFLALVASDAKNPESHLRLGDFYLAQTPPKREAATKSYETAVALEPSNPAPYLRLADMVLSDAERDPAVVTRAEEYLRRFEELAPGDPQIGYLKGKILLAQGKKAEALPFLEEFVKLRPDASAGLYYYAKALRAADRAEDALAPLERASRLRPRDAALRLELAHLQHELGSKAFAKGDYAAARALLARADEGGARQGSRFLLAGAAANLGQFDLSERECRAALERDPSDTGTKHLLAVILVQRGGRAGLDEAEVLYRGIRDANPADLLADIGIASIKFLKGLVAEALADFKAIYPKTAGEPCVALAIAQCYVAQQQTPEALKFLETEVAAHPDSAAFPHVLGDFLVHAKQYDLAVKQYTRAAEMNPDDDMAIIAAAAALLEANRAEEARVLLEKRLPVAKNPAPILVAIGELQLRAGRTADGTASLRRAVSIAPDHSRALYLLGKVAETEGRRDEAKRLYADAVAKRVIDPECYVRLARMRQTDGELDSARDLFRKAVTIDPRNIAALNSLALLVANDPARLDEAVGYAERALSLAPNMPELLDTYGWLQFRVGKPDVAAMPLLRAADLLPTNATVQYHAGVVTARLRRDTDARTFFERALRIDPKFPEADACRKELADLPK